MKLQEEADVSQQSCFPSTAESTMDEALTRLHVMTPTSRYIAVGAYERSHWGEAAGDMAGEAAGDEVLMRGKWA